MNPRSQLWLVAGPNGAGKTTLVRFGPLADLLPRARFFDPDDLTLELLRARGVPTFAEAQTDVLNRTFVEAAEQTFTRLESLLHGGETVCVETVLWRRSLELLPWFAERATQFWVFDNSDSSIEKPPLLLAQGANGLCALLRKNCPCATCRTERDAAGRQQPAALSLTILPKGIERATEVADASLVGNYAINIVWGDGHSTGIYDFRYLRSIAPA